jgi:hypothetical protein
MEHGSEVLILFVEVFVIIKQLIGPDPFAF